MPSATIRSFRNGITPITGESRDDLAIGDIVTVESVHTHNTYSWSIAYKPEGSAAAFSGSAANPSPGTFTVDLEGPYLIRFIADMGLSTESEQFVRLRYLTVFGELKLVAAGEQYGGAVNIPVDAAFTGWADEQNTNLRTILRYLSKVSQSGRVLYVDNTPGYGDYTSIQDAIDDAATSASISAPWAVLVRPGTYTEDLTFVANVHVIAWNGTPIPQSNVRIVEIRGVHSADVPNIADRLILSGLSFTVHVANTSPCITKTGLGSGYITNSRVGVDVSSGSQGPAIQLDEGSITIIDCSIEVAAANPVTVFGVSQTDGTLQLTRTIVRAPSGITATGGMSTITDTSIVSTGGVGAWGVYTDASLTTLEYASVSGALGTGVPVIGVHVGAGVLGSDVRFTANWSAINGGLTFDTTGIGGVTELTLNSVAVYTLTFPGAIPTRTTLVRSDTIAYDNTTSGLAATDVQSAIDEIVSVISPFATGYTLQSAYDGGGPGAGRSIIANAGAIQILDAATPSDPIPAGNTNGNIEVVGKVSVGAITKPEIDVDPNPYGTGPQIRMGWTTVPNNSPTGVGVATVVARSTESPLYRNYDLRVGTEPASGGGKVGDLVLRAGDGTQGGGATPNAGAVYVIAGSGLDGLAVGGDVFLVPGLDTGGTTRPVRFVDPATATVASITAAGVATDPVGVSGTIMFATDMGAVTATISDTDTLATVVSKLDALLGLAATETGGIITVASRTTGPSARVYFLSATTGLDAALGGFDGQIMAVGTYANQVTFHVTGANEITIGSTGATGPLVYNADTGKLTIPGLIDPTGIVFTAQLTNPAPVAVNTGTFWVRDNTPSVPMFTDDSGDDWQLQKLSSSGVPVGSPLAYLINMPDNPNDTVEYRGWVPYIASLVGVRAYMGTINTQGNYTLDIVNQDTGNSCLDGGVPFDMNGLVADTVTNVPLKPTGDADLNFPALGRWTILLSSDDIAFDGQDIYIELVFGVV